MKLQIKKLRPNAIIPEFKTAGSVAMDFHASLEAVPPTTRGMGDREFVLLPGEIVAMPLGVAIQLEPGYEMRIRSRSNMILKGISVVTYDMYEDDKKAGTIDSDYRGEVHALLHNDSSHAFIITEGMRVCQGIITRAECPGNDIEIQIVDELEPTVRGEQRFGHTGE